MREVVETNVSLYLISSSFFSCNVYMWECGAKSDSGKKKKQGRERAEGTSFTFTPYPTLGLPVFPAHGDLCLPHNLNAWNEAFQGVLATSDIAPKLQKM